MKYFILFAVLFLAVPAGTFSQAPADYRDVGLVINDNDTNSTAIGAYFAAKRGIPERNIIHIRTSRSETINDSTFEALRRQVEQYILSAGLRDSLNYLVLTKGVPHRVDRGGTGGDLNSRSASVDAELMLILGQWSQHIGQATLVIPPNSVRVHPYFNRSEPYERSRTIPGASTSYDMYLVTRLTGLSKEDVFSLIDRSGPNTLVDSDSAQFVLDMDPTPIQASYNNNMSTAADMLRQRGWRVQLNRDSVYLTEQRNVIGYTSWGSNDHFDHHYTQYARPRNHWLPGSIAETYVSTSARNFVPGSTSGQSRIADLIAEGCAGASGYVFEPFTVALSWVNILFDRYAGGYNLADSYYMSMPTMSWMAIVVGDPKTTIISSVPPAPAPAIAGIEPLCAGDAAVLRATGALRGNMHWFAGDTTSVKAASESFDKHHPLWIGSDSVLAYPVPDAGIYSFSFFNENFVGRGWAQTSVEVTQKPKAGFIASAELVYLDRDPTIDFTDTSKGAVTLNWDFGDGSPATADANPRHTFTQAGLFTVTQQAVNAHCSDIARKNIRVEEHFQTAVEGPHSAPMSTEILAVAPNPMREKSAIRFYLARTDRVEIHATDALGRIQARIHEGIEEAGIHELHWDASAVPPGCYTLRVNSAGASASRQIIVLR